MTDLPALFINAGILVGTLAAAAIAWWQAIAAGRQKVDAEKASTRAEVARTAAVATQQRAAEALAEANRIAADARDLLRKQDARETERHRVKWVPSWDFQRGVWLLGNHGPDTALNVRLSVESPTIDRVVLPEEDELPMNRGLPVEFSVYAGQGGMPRVHWSVDWKTPLGSERHEAGVWPE